MLLESPFFDGWISSFGGYWWLYHAIIYPCPPRKTSSLTNISIFGPYISCSIGIPLVIYSKVMGVPQASNGWLGEIPIQNGMIITRYPYFFANPHRTLWWKHPLWYPHVGSAFWISRRRMNHLGWMSLRFQARPNCWKCRLGKAGKKLRQKSSVKSRWILQYPDANHGAGIFTYKTTPYLWPSYVGKYSIHGASGIQNAWIVYMIGCFFLNFLYNTGNTVFFCNE